MHSGYRRGDTTGSVAGAGGAGIELASWSPSTTAISAGVGVSLSLRLLLVLIKVRYLKLPKFGQILRKKFPYHVYQPLLS